MSRINSLNEYLARSQEWLLKAVFKQEVLKVKELEFSKKKTYLNRAHPKVPQ